MKWCPGGCNVKIGDFRDTCGRSECQESSYLENKKKAETRPCSMCKTHDAFVKFDGTGDLCTCCLASREMAAMRKAFSALLSAFSEETARWRQLPGAGSPTPLMMELAEAIDLLRVEVVQR